MRPDAGFLYNRESEDIENFFNEFYSETDVEPKKIEYIEANAVGKIMRTSVDSIFIISLRKKVLTIIFRYHCKIFIFSIEFCGFALLSLYLRDFILLF